MPNLEYVSKNFRPDTLRVIERAVQICEEYEAQGFDLTLRQLYYQFVSRDWLPNTVQSYNKLGSIISDARLAGLLDWNFIVDRGRELKSLNHWDTPGGVIRDASRWFNRELWADQPKRVEVWIEKDALSGVIAPTCRGLDVPYFACKGYTSQSEMWAAAQRLLQYAVAGQQVVILHLGDHDPSGIDMTRDIQERLDLFFRRDISRHWAHQWWEENPEFDGEDDAQREKAVAWVTERSEDTPLVDVQRIALTMDQVLEYTPPPNPAKVTDSRFEGYEAIYGDESWELDALDPTTLAALISDSINEHLDPDLYDAAVERENVERARVKAVADRWDEIEAFLSTEEEQ